MTQGLQLPIKDEPESDNNSPSANTAAVAEVALMVAVVVTAIAVAAVVAVTLVVFATMAVVLAMVAIAVVAVAAVVGVSVGPKYIAATGSVSYPLVARFLLGALPPPITALAHNP